MQRFNLNLRFDTLPEWFEKTARETIPPNFRGLPVIDQAKCGSGCGECVNACPTEALSNFQKLRLDLGRCVFCNVCTEACPDGAITYSAGYQMSARERDHLILDGDLLRVASKLNESIHLRLGRSLKLKHVSSGDCGACRAEVDAMTNHVFDIYRLGIELVPSHRQADGLLITGAIAANMRVALEKLYSELPEPKLVVAVGSCAISGGPFRDHPEVLNGAESLFKVDLFVPGCPPHPLTIIDGLLRMIGRLPEKTSHEKKAS